MEVLLTLRNIAYTYRIHNRFVRNNILYRIPRDHSTHPGAEVVALETLAFSILNMPVHADFMTARGAGGVAIGPALDQASLRKIVRACS